MKSENALVTLNRMKLSAIIVFILFLGFNSYSQTSTTIDLQNKEKKKVEYDTITKPRLLIIPFDEKMYLSDVNKSINRETKKTFPEIRDEFRFGINSYLKSQFRDAYEVTTLLDDTAKMKKDLVFAYNSIGLKYVSVATGKENKTSNIKNGQLVSSSVAEERYMNTVLKGPSLMAFLKKKYKADYVLFINELDIKNDVNSLGATGKRNASIHYTLYDINGKQIKGGLAKAQFSSGVNDIKKIMSSSFPAMTKTISVGTPKVAYREKEVK